MTPSILVVQHEDDCGPDRLAGWLADAGVALDVRRPYAGDPLPATVAGAEGADGADGLVVLGGSMGAGDDAGHPWLTPTRALLADAVTSGTPTLGICLGAQLLAAACGGRVEVGGPGIEPGVLDIRWRPAAADDPLCAGLPDPYPGPSMHKDAIVVLPPGAVWLAETDIYPHQVFRVGGAAWGVQFHPEVSEATFRSWTPGCAEDLALAGTDADRVVGALVARDAEVVAAGRALASRFGALVGQRAGLHEPSVT